MSTSPKAFISYSWEDDDAHKEWVLNLATRLRTDGIDVTLDQWHVAPGDLLADFMEKSIRENDFIIIVCTPHYKKRSDHRLGGVGYEGDIMTAEVLTEKNHRKFIPVLRKGTWAEAAPSWLKGKCYIRLIKDTAEADYLKLRTTLLGQRAEPPPLGSSAQRSADPGAHPNCSPPSRPQRQPPATEEISGPIKILGVISEEVGKPRNDGMRGSALYSVPLRLSRTPSPEWARLFVQTWDMPPSFSTMHRPGIARVYSDQVVLDGTTIEEIERYHKETLVAVLEAVNEKIQRYEAQQERRRQEKMRAETERQEKVRETANRLRFD